MGQFVIPIMMIASAGAQIASNRQATGAQQVELEMEKRGEAAMAQDREVQRKRRLSAILGAQSAEAAAAGLSMTGSVANITLADAKEASRESTVDRANTRGRIDTMSRQSRSLGRLSNVRTATTILSTAASLYGGMGAGPKGSAGPSATPRYGTGPN